MLLGTVGNIFGTLLWNSFQCHHIIFFPPETFIPRRQTVFLGTEVIQAKSGEQGGCSISAIDLWARNCLTESAL
jgi:hypothetical protein